MSADPGMTAIETFAITSLALLALSVASADEDIEFVQEHLPEVAMDNRYATLPIWNGPAVEYDDPELRFQSALTATSAGSLQLSGAMFAIGARWSASRHWDVGTFAFYDPLQFKSQSEVRDLQTLFAPQTPIERPVAARFSSLSGSATDAGFGVYATRESNGGPLAAHRWVLGALWQRIELEDYRFDYRVLEGPQAGFTGTIDFDAGYTHVVPFIGLELPRSYGKWSTNAHVLIAYPSPRRGVAGHITGPDFDIHGNTEESGNGKHFGDPSLTFGYTITYLPARVSFDLGTFLSQAALEPRVHRGIERNMLLSFSVDW